MKIKFDHTGESEVFKIGEDEIYFVNTSESIYVAEAQEGGPYSHTTNYIHFKNIEAAEKFLKEAITIKECPYGWD